MVHSRCKRMLVSPSPLKVSELVPHQASKLGSKHKSVSKHITPSLMLLIGLPMHLLGVLHKESNFNCYCSNPNAENVTWPSLILVASLPWEIVRPSGLRPSPIEAAPRSIPASSVTNLAPPSQMTSLHIRHAPAECTNKGRKCWNHYQLVNLRPVGVAGSRRNVSPRVTFGATASYSAQLRHIWPSCGPASAAACDRHLTCAAPSVLTRRWRRIIVMKLVLDPDAWIRLHEGFFVGLDNPVKMKNFFHQLPFAFAWSYLTWS